MIKLSTAILLLVKAEPLVCSLEPNLNEVFVALLSKLECLKSVGYIRVSRSKRNKQKICFKTLDKGRRWKHFILRVQGLPLACLIRAIFTYTLS